MIADMLESSVISLIRLEEGEKAERLWSRIIKEGQQLWWEEESGVRIGVIRLSHRRRIAVEVVSIEKEIHIALIAERSQRSGEWWPEKIWII